MPLTIGSRSNGTRGKEAEKHASKFAAVITGIVIGAGAVAFCAPPAAADAPAPSAQENQQAPVDPATKQLMAVNGLFQRGLYDLAAQEYTDFLKQNPNHPQATIARYALAICDYRLGRFDQAAEQLNLVLKDPKFAQRDEALAVLGHSELSLKHYDQAIAALDELLSKFPQSKQTELASLNRAQAYYLAGQFPKAAAALEKFLADYPKSDNRQAALYFLAFSQRAQDQNEQAIKTAAQLAADNTSPYRVDALLLAGQAQEALKNYPAAIEAYRQLLAAAPDARKAQAHYVLGLALAKASQFDESAREMLASIAAQSTGEYAAPARMQLGLDELSAGKYTEARQTLEAVIKQDASRAAEAKYALAQCDMAEKKFDAARQRLGELLELKPPPSNVAQIALDRAVCLMSTGKFPEASAEFDAFIKQNPASPQTAEAMYRQAYCLHELKKFDQSHALLQQLGQRPAAQLPPGFATSAAELDADNLFALGKYADASKAFSALSANEKDAGKKNAFAIRIGQCAYFSGDYAKAADLLQQALASAGNSDDARQAEFLLGDALLQSGKNASAAEALDKYLAAAQTAKTPDADLAEALFKAGLAHLRAGDTAKAQPLLARASQGAADSAWVQRALLETGQLAYKARQPAQASDALNKLLAAKPPAELAAPAIYVLGWIDFDAGKFTEAATRWESATRDYPSASVATDARFERGVALKEAGKLDQAAPILQAFASEHPDSPNAGRARQLAAECLTQEGKPQEAVQALAVLSADPKASDAVLYDLAWAQRNANNLSAAMDTYKRLLSAHPGSKLTPAVRLELGELLYNAHQYQNAADLLALIAGAKEADSPTVDAKMKLAASYRLAWCYDRLGQMEKAAALFTAYAADPHAAPDLAAPALLEAAVDDAQQSKFDPAQTLLKQLLKTYPNDARCNIAMLKLGEVQAELSEFDASGQTYTAWLAKYPTDKLAYRANFGLGWSLENRKQYAQARAAYLKVIAADNGETAARAQFQIGETWLDEGNFDKAIGALLAVEDVYAYPAWSARALLEAGRAFEQIKQPDHAKEQYQQVVTKYKDTPEAQMAQQRLTALAAPASPAPKK